MRNDFGTLLMKSTAAVICGMMAAPPALPAQQAATPAQQQAPVLAAPPKTTSQIVQNAADQGYTLSVNANIVLTNVVVRDKAGNVVKGLKATDFSITEDKKSQTVVSFDYQNVDQAAVLAEKTTIGHASIADMLNNDFAASPKELKDHRLIVMFFDFSTMQDDDTDRAVDAATKYVNEQMQPADLVSMVSMSTGLTMDQDFTSNKQALLRVLAKYNGDDDSSGFAAGGDGTTDGTSDDASSFSADDSEFNSLNTDRELYAIRTIAKSLERVDQRKSMLYFSGGLSRQGIENQASLRAATNEAAKANLAIYTVDSRGLQALPPVGDSRKGSTRGQAAYNGASVSSQFKSNFSSQETLQTLATDTGGKAFFDSNNFGPAFQAIQHDTEAYYILGFRSTNPARDGQYRHLTVLLKNHKDYKLEYRPGYYAPSDYQHQKTEDREYALKEQMRSDLPATDVPVYLQALYFRASDNKFFIPISILIPGSAIPFTQKGNADKATLDIIGQVKGTNDVDFGNVRDTLKLNVSQDQQASKRNIQYTTSFLLAPGHYHLKFVVRMNSTGAMGSFETDIAIPDFKKVPLKLSSVMLSTQRTPAGKKDESLLIRDGQQWVPNVAHVIRQDQHLYFLYEVYDPTKPKDAPAAQDTPGLKNRQGAAAHLITSIEFLQNGAKVYETSVVTADQENVPQRGAVAFQFDVPASQLKPGTYICQVNVIDDAGGNFSFPRMAVRIQKAAPPVVAPAPPVAATPAPAGGQ